jgi:hypothetical protein
MEREVDLKGFLNAAGIEIDEKSVKIHFASNQGSDPLLAFYEGRFKTWQQEQTQRNFSRPYVLGLIQLEDKASWLFAGIYKVLMVSVGAQIAWQYETELVPGQEDLIGRVVVRYAKSFRNSYPAFETCGESLRVVEFRKERASIASFPGYKNVLLKKQELDVVVSQNLESWRSALSSVSGVYVIVDRSSGKQYVGSAYGEGGIWSRWCQYSLSGHGNNKELRALLKQESSSYSQNFQFSILEVCDLSFSKDQVIARESHWKNALCSREHGLNSN